MAALETCYVCKNSGPRHHDFYERLCPQCGDLNYEKRQSTADLTGFSALVTGGRIKIGFETALKLLRCGARVMVTTRFGEDARDRFACQPDAESWFERLHVCASDFRSLASISTVVDRVRSDFGRLDVLVNNAAQTIRRPPVFYRHLIDSLQLGAISEPTDLVPMIEAKLLGMNYPATDLSEQQVAQLSQIEILSEDAASKLRDFPAETFDKDGQQVDLRDFNSWMMKLEDVHLVEFLEVLYINLVAPFVLITELAPIMRCRLSGQLAFIVNVSAMEGNFADPEKNARHPHTNMAKAALNMMTRSSAMDLQERGILMTAVDPGWITDEKPVSLQLERVKTPIDDIDGAARICDPIFRALNEDELIFGVLLKNYMEHPW